MAEERRQRQVAIATINNWLNDNSVLGKWDVFDDNVLGMMAYQIEEFKYKEAKKDWDDFRKVHNQGE